MSEVNKRQQRRRESEYWDKHGIDEGEGEEVAVEVRKPLSEVLSVRLGPDDMGKLKLLANAQGVGITTMARMLLHQCLENPKNQLVWQALQSEAVKGKIAGIIEDAKVPPGEGNPAFLVLPVEQLYRIGELINQTASGLFVEALREKSVTIDPQGELYEQLRQLETVQS